MSEKKNVDEVETIEVTPEGSNEEAEIEELEEIELDKIKKLKKDLKDCKAEKGVLMDDLQRSKADFLNARKRLEDEKHRDRGRAVNSIIEQLLPLCDSFHMAMSNQVLWESVNPEWRSGVEGINNQLNSLLQAHGVKALNPIGEKFDPHQHEAVSNVSVDAEDKDHTVISVLQLGYERANTDKKETLRPARVIVGEFKE